MEDESERPGSSSVIENQIKVTYRTLDGGTSKAYVDETTLEGEDKWTGERVKVFWSTSNDTYMETYIYVPPIPFTEKVPFIRIQPKKLTRKQRRKNG